MVVASTPPAMLLINPAFLQEIKDGNPDLGRTLAELRQLLYGNQLHLFDDSGDSLNSGVNHAASTHVGKRLARLLDDLREHLSLQFSLEESYGYIAVVNPHNRGLCQQTCQVQSQHRRLYMLLSDLAEQAEELQYRGVESAQLGVLLQRAREFDADYRNHELAELELLERYFERS